MDGWKKEKRRKPIVFPPGEPIANISVMPSKFVLPYMSWECKDRAAFFLSFTLFFKIETFIAFAGF